MEKSYSLISSLIRLMKNVPFFSSDFLAMAASASSLLIKRELSNLFVGVVEDDPDGPPPDLLRGAAPLAGGLLGRWLFGGRLLLGRLLFCPLAIVVAFVRVRFRFLLGLFFRLFILAAGLDRFDSRRLSSAGGPRPPRPFAMCSPPR